MEKSVKTKIFYPWTIEYMKDWKQLHEKDIRIIGSAQSQYKNNKTITIYYEEKNGIN